jgi:hypothetical protein
LPSPERDGFVRMSGLVGSALGVLFQQILCESAATAC